MSEDGSFIGHVGKQDIIGCEHLVRVGTIPSLGNIDCELSSYETESLKAVSIRF